MKRKEAIEIIKKNYPDSNFTVLREALETLIPELKESEDEKIRNVLVDYFKKYKEQEECGIKTFFGIPTDNIISWLEKKGEQKPQGKSAIEAINEEKVGNANKVEQKSAWSEEDESILNEAIYFIRREPYRERDAEPIVNWLKTLKGRVQSQNTWKPSDEQIKVLVEVIIFAANHESPHWNDYIFGILKNLTRQLKKLREE